MARPDSLELSPVETAMLSGAEGEVLQFAMEVVVRAAQAMEAERLREISFIHVDACHYHGKAHLDFARFFVDRGFRFSIPAWTNTVPVSLIQDEVRDGAAPEALENARALAENYVALGAKPVWTCAPYQLPGGPRLGDDIVVGESNAVVYFNSVVGARTNKYGDFLDVCAGATCRVPDAGLHRTEARRGRILVNLGAIPHELRHTELFCHVLGHYLGRQCGSIIPVISGLPGGTPKDSLKALGAASAASGGLVLFHAVGLTPEAPTLEDALHGQEPERTLHVLPQDLVAAREALSSAGPGAIDMVALGTPHFSFDEFARLVAHLDGRKVHDDVTLYVSTSRHVAARAAQEGWITVLERAGAEILLDTCTYFAPAVRGCRGRVMTNSAKWAYYAPAMLPVQVAFGSLADCVESAVRGEVRRDETQWSDQAWGL